MGRGKRRGRLPLSIDGAAAAVPVFGTLVAEARVARHGSFPDGLDVRAYLTGDRRYRARGLVEEGTAVVVERERGGQYCRAYLGRTELGEEAGVAYVSDAGDDVVALVRPSPAHGEHVAEVVDQRSGAVVLELFLQDGKDAAAVFDRGGDLAGLVKAKRGQRLHLPLAGVAAYGLFVIAA